MDWAHNMGRIWPNKIFMAVNQTSPTRIDPIHCLWTDPGNDRTLQPTTFSRCGGGGNRYIMAATRWDKPVKPTSRTWTRRRLWRSSPCPFCRPPRRRIPLCFHLLRHRLDTLIRAPFVCCRRWIRSGELPPWGRRAAAGVYWWSVWLPMKRRWPAVRLSISPSWVSPSFFPLIFPYHFGWGLRSNTFDAGKFFSILRYWAWESWNYLIISRPNGIVECGVCFLLGRKSYFEKWCKITSASQIAVENASSFRKKIPILSAELNSE